MPWADLFNNIVHTGKPDSKFMAASVNGAPGPEGRMILLRGDASLLMIPAKATHVANAIRVLEFWHLEKGCTLGTLKGEGEGEGEGEGYDCTMADGKAVLTDIGKQHSLNHGIHRVATTTWKNPMGALPGIWQATQSNDALPDSGSDLARIKALSGPVQCRKDPPKCPTEPTTQSRHTGLLRQPGTPDAKIDSTFIGLRTDQFQINAFGAQGWLEWQAWLGADSLL